MRVSLLPALSDDQLDAQQAMQQRQLAIALSRCRKSVGESAPGIFP